MTDKKRKFPLATYNLPNSFGVITSKQTIFLSVVVSLGVVVVQTGVLVVQSGVAVVQLGVLVPRVSGNV